MNEAIKELKQLRSEFALTKIEIATGCKVVEMTVNRWLSNSNTPSLQHISAIENFIYSTRKAFAEKEAREIEIQSDLILAMIYDGDYEFAPLPGKKESAFLTPHGRLRKVILLEKDIEIKAIEALARAGKIQILRLKLDRRMSRNDVAFSLDLGVAKRAVPSMVIAPEKSLKDNPLSPDSIVEAEAGGFLILNIFERVKNMRAQKIRSLESHFGKVSDIESRLHREAVEDESAVRIHQKEIIEALKNKGGKKMRSDEYTEIKTLEKVKEIVEIKRVNETLVPQIFYNHDGTRLELQPGQSGIQTKTEQIKKPKVEKKIIKK